MPIYLDLYHKNLCISLFVGNFMTLCMYVFGWNKQNSEYLMPVAVTFENIKINAVSLSIKRGLGGKGAIFLNMSGVRMVYLVEGADFSMRY